VARARETREEKVVGVNAYPEGNPRFSLFPDSRQKGTPVLRITPEQEARQVSRVRRWRRQRDEARARQALDALRAGTVKGQNVMPLVLTAIVRGATLGEISDVWREQFGEHRPSRAF
jgi:methylmalonyl-CoA mutase N-terminal domain/subunit